MLSFASSGTHTFFHSNALEFWVRIIPLIPLWWVNDPNFVDYILGQMAALAIL